MDYLGFLGPLGHEEAEIIVDPSHIVHWRCFVSPYACQFQELVFEPLYLGTTQIRSQPDTFRLELSDRRAFWGGLTYTTAITQDFQDFGPEAVPIATENKTT